MEIHEPIDQKKKLNIIAIADDSPLGISALCHGGMLAAVFHASLTVVTRFGFSLEESKDKTYADKVLQNIQQLLAHDIETLLPANYFFPESLYKYAEETNTIMFVIGVDNAKNGGLFNRRKAIRFIKPSRVPVMTVGQKLPDKEMFRHVLLPVDIERQAKEKALWASYFNRFYGSTIQVLHPIYKDAGLKKQLNDNLAFIERLYHNLEVDYQIDGTEANGVDIDIMAIDYAPKVNASLSVIMMTQFFSPSLVFTGRKEKKIIGNEKDFPVLCINQRDDLYVLCT